MRGCLKDAKMSAEFGTHLLAKASSMHTPATSHENVNRFIALPQFPFFLPFFRLSETAAVGKLRIVHIPRQSLAANRALTSWDG